MSAERAHSTGASPAGPVVASSSTAVEALTTTTDNLYKGQVTTSSEPSGPHSANVGHPQEQLEVEEPGNTNDDIVYPTGSKLWLTYVSLLVVLFLNGLDLAIVAVTVPSLTDQFHTIDDIGWYSAVYGLVYASCTFFFGKCYTVFKTKHVYLFGLATFELGSLICTFAHSSKALIIGRAVAGFGAGAYGGGTLKILRDLFPMSKQAMVTGAAGGIQCVGLISAPMVGGLLIGAFSWRACFGVNLPLGVMAFAFTFWGFSHSTENPDFDLPLKEKIKRLDLPSTLVIIPAIICLLMGLQWGGIKYGWKDARIIALFVLFAVLFSAFAYMQYRLGEKATVPPRIIKQRSILGALWFSSCANGIMAMTENYISIYFQGVRGYSPSKSGLLSVPLLVGFTAAYFVASAGTTWFGYYYPFVFATSILAPIASGLLTTIALDNSIIKPAALLAFVGIAVGIGIQGPTLAIQTSSTTKDISIAAAVNACGATLGSAMWICVSSTLFQNRLRVEIVKYAPTVNATAIETAGLSQIRGVIGRDKLRDVLSGYNEAVVETLYLPLALGVLTIIGSLAMERNSIKKKTS